MKPDIEPDMKPANPVTVTLCLGSQSFQKGLAKALLRNGMLRRVVSFGLDLEIFDPQDRESLRLVRKYPSYRIGNRILWGIWRRLPVAKYSPHLPINLSVSIADRLASRWIPPCSIYHGWTSLCLAGLRTAKRHGSTTLIESATMHPRHWQEAVLQECDVVGINPRDCRATLPPFLIERTAREFELCDKIVVPSLIAQESFEKLGYSGKAIVIHAGVDHHYFTPSPVPTKRELFRVCYVGRVELAKGLTYLLDAWKRLELTNAELLLVGDVAPEMHSVIKRYALPNIRFKGFSSQDEVAQCYRDSDLFVFPSVNEGLARVLLEAMASELPVIATDKSGAEDCITQGQEGTIVPARDANALAEAILWHFQHREESIAMGRAGRIRIEQDFTLAHYEERMLGLYRSLPDGRAKSN
jgi:glycosyltransferase involved in cell wall biosynthesis